MKNYLVTLPLKIPGPYRGSCGWPFQRSKLNFAFFTILISSNSEKGLFYCTQKKDSLRNLQILFRLLELAVCMVVQHQEGCEAIIIQTTIYVRVSFSLVDEARPRLNLQ